MTLNVQLEFADPEDRSSKPRLSVTLKGDECGEELPQHTETPFSPKELSILLRALETSSAVAHEFATEEVGYLKQIRIIDKEKGLAIKNGRVRLSREQLDSKQLRRYLCDGMRQALFGKQKLREALFKELAAFDPISDKEAAFQIHLKIYSKQVSLFSYPWELLHFDEDDLWRTANAKISLSRYIQYPGRRQSLMRSKNLNILVLHCDPRIPHRVPLQPRDSGEIADGLEKARYGRKFKIVGSLNNPTLVELTHWLRSRQNTDEFPHILHFAGHSEFGRCCFNGHFTASLGASRCPQCDALLPVRGNPESFEGFLGFCNATGGVDWVSAARLYTVLKPYSLQLVVLNACKSGLARRGENIFNGVAQRLMQRIPAVVASPFLLDNLGAEKFAFEFYYALGSGHALSDALFLTHCSLAAYPELDTQLYRYALYLRGDVEAGGQLLDLAQLKLEESRLVPGQTVELLKSLLRKVPDETALIEFNRYKETLGQEAIFIDPPRPDQQTWDYLFSYLQDPGWMCGKPHLVYYMHRLAHTLKSAELKQWTEQTAQDMEIKLPALPTENQKSKRGKFCPHLLLGLEKADNYYTLHAWIEDEPGTFGRIIDPEKIDPTESANMKNRIAKIFSLPDVNAPCRLGELGALEFFLPLEFFNFDLDDWTPENEKLLAATYRIIFRSAERLFKKRWLYDWGNYWRAHKAHFSENNKCRCAWLKEPPDFYSDYLDDGKCVLGLEFVPDENCFEKLFQDGAAILIWWRLRRDEPERQGQKNAIAEMTTEELPQWLLKERKQYWKKTRRASTGPLALLWDDPDRLPDDSEIMLESCD